METTVVCWGYIGIMVKNMETTTVYWGMHTNETNLNPEP